VLKRILVTLRPSPALLVAFLALAVALGGTSYAAIRLPKNSVASKQLKKASVTRDKVKANAIDGSKVAANSLTGRDINESTLAAVPSAASATTAANANHANAAGAIDRLTYKAATGTVAPADATDPADVKSTHGVATALCDQGQHVVGGGVRVDDVDNTAVIDSFPDGGGTAWTARVDNGDPTAAHGFTVSAICTTAVNAG
jgi:hypothetical protein